MVLPFLVRFKGCAFTNDCQAKILEDSRIIVSLSIWECNHFSYAVLIIFIPGAFFRLLRIIFHA